MEPRIQYAKTSDGINIAYATAGGGPLVFCIPSPPVSHVQLLWESMPLHRDMAEHFRFVWYDSRGSGLSDRDALDFSMDAMLRDLEAVTGRVGAPRFALYGAYDAVPIAIQYAVTYPARITHLLFVDGRADFSDYYQTPPAISAEAALRHQDWIVYSETLARVLIGFDDNQVAAHFGELIRACTDPEALRACFSQQGNESWNVSHLLDKITTPTIVLHNRGNRFLSTQVGQRLASRIAEARFQIVDDMLYAGIAGILANFVSETTTETASSLDSLSGTAVILFADIADSTALTEHLGDATFRAKARELDGALRAIIREHGGNCIDAKTLGDGVLATFTSARQAIAAAMACRVAGDDAGLPLHLGIHAGDVIREDDNVFGGAVNIAARISAMSAAGEVLVSDTVRSLARTSAGVTFEDRGEQALKGVGEPVRVYEVRWRS